jgi:hypothetical protein
MFIVFPRRFRGHVVPALRLAVTRCYRRSLVRSATIPRNHTWRRWCPALPRSRCLVISESQRVGDSEQSRAVLSASVTITTAGHIDARRIDDSAESREVIASTSHRDPSRQGGAATPHARSIALGHQAVGRARQANDLNQALPRR